MTVKVVLVILRVLEEFVENWKYYETEKKIRELQ